MRLIFSFALVVLVACGGANSDVPKSSSPPHPSTAQGTALVPDSLLHAVYRTLLAFGDSRNAVRAHRGAPRKAAIEPTPNRYDPAQTDTAVHWSFGDADFWFLVAGGQDFLFEVRVPSTYSSIADRVSALATPSQAEALVGRPSWNQQRSDTTIIGYAIRQQEPGSAEDMLKFYYVAAHLVAVGAVPYVD